MQQKTHRKKASEQFDFFFEEQAQFDFISMQTKVNLSFFQVTES